MKNEDIRPEAVVDEPVREVPNVPDDIYSDTPATEDVPVLTLADTGVDAPVLDADADEKMAEDVSAEAGANDAASVNPEVADGADETAADESVLEVSAESDETAAEGSGDETADEGNGDEVATDVTDDAAADEELAEDAEDTPTEEMTGDEDAHTDDGEEITEEDNSDETVGEDDTSLSDDTIEETVPTKANESVKETPQKAETKEKKTAKDKVGERRVDGLFDFIELFVFTLAIVLFVTSFFVRQSVVEGDSMLGTLHDKETLLISDFFYEPKRGDIVVVDDRSAYHVPIIKRVIAVGGDTVRITKVGVIVNGELLDEPYVYTDGGKYEYRVEYRDIAHTIKQYETLNYKDGEYYEFVVPEGKIFVMGDHRNASTDSRDIGPVDVDAVLGRVIYRILPFSEFGRVE